MNHWHNEYMAEIHRRQILREAEEIRLEKVSMQARLYRPGWFERTMFHVANWMIASGKQLRKRYEVPAVPCNPPQKESFAH